MPCGRLYELALVDCDGRRSAAAGPDPGRHATWPGRVGAAPSPDRASRASIPGPVQMYRSSIARMAVRLE